MAASGFKIMLKILKLTTRSM